MAIQLHTSIIDAASEEIPVLTDEIPLSGPDITKLEREAVMAVLNSRYLSLGPKLPEFERRMAQIVGAKHAVAVNSGTSGLHLCVKALGIGEGDEVITTPFSFVASANCLLYERAVPVFVDIDPLTFNMDPTQIEEKITPKTKAILPVHVFGQPCDMDPILRLAAKHHLRVIEDACEAIGAEYKGRRAGGLGDCGVFAFYPNKQMTTGEGGVVVTNQSDVASLCRSLRNHGRGENGSWLDHERLGYNYRLSEIQCALGVAQLKRIDEILSQRARVARLYNTFLEEVPGIRRPFISADVKMSWFVYVVLLDDSFDRCNRDRLLTRLHKRGIGCSNYFPSIHLQPLYVRAFDYKKGDFPVTESISDRTIALPFYTRLGEEQISQVADALKHEIKSLL